MNINELVQTSHNAACGKGFYDCDTCKGTGFVETSAINFTVIRQMCPDCHGTGKARKNVGELLMLIVSELGEALEAHRKGNKADWEEYHRRVNLMTLSGMAQKGAEETAFKMTLSNSFEFELADAVIRIADTCGYLGIDLERCILAKLEYNSTRPYRHGKRY